MSHVPVWVWFAGAAAGAFVAAVWAWWHARVWERNAGAWQRAAGMARAEARRAWAVAVRADPSLGALTRCVPLFRAPPGEDSPVLPPPLPRVR